MAQWSMTPTRTESCELSKWNRKLWTRLSPPCKKSWSATVGRRLRSNALVFRSEEHTSELQSRFDLVCRLLLEKKKEQEKDEMEKIEVTENENAGAENDKR